MSLHIAPPPLTFYKILTYIEQEIWEHFQLHIYSISFWKDWKKPRKFHYNSEVRTYHRTHLCKEYIKIGILSLNVHSTTMKFSVASVVLLLFTSVNCKDCWVKGRCQGFLVDLSMTSTQEDCLSHCQDLSQCKWFTYDNAHGSCATFSTCSTWDTECETCISGEFDCQVHTSNLPMFFTIISYAPKGPAQCFVTGRCTQSISVSIDFTDNAEDCLYACKAHAECAWFSFDPAMKSCILLSECNTLDTSNYGMGCSRCISGQKRVRWKQWFRGEMLDSWEV